MDAIDSVINPLKEFAKDSVRLAKRCHEPNFEEIMKLASRVRGMGFGGFFVKLIFIPINDIIVGSR
ncbi:protein transport protein Sec61 subunit gamma-like [Tripterygium wilfordii]|uniref:protein transport protein Sec61 subunit gamma-like n=1 Tax=Tripterygium wilfordii TaxID=458696 RepID=UPI0018F85E61|nr:protein transport protein Sec61 subunit gamma-like [Tripterygium wilfordii]XP_038717147.1 protein transport protein Sec61 subunit gamma-like [Tripterygium wilfordii]